MRRIVTALIALAVALAGIVLGAPQTRASDTLAMTAASDATRPNILFLLTDDMAYSELSVMPHVRALLAHRGTSFSRAFVSVSLCCPSRTTFLRGQYSHNTGIETNNGTNGGFETAHYRGVEESTIATWLHAGGYRTGLFGKYLNGYPSGVSDTYVPPGWDEFVSATLGGNAYREFGYNLNANGHVVHYGNAPSDYGTDVYSHLASDFIRRAGHDGKPFFAFLPVYAPHIPATPAPRDANRFPNAMVPRTGSYNEADLRDKPAWLRDIPLMTPAIESQVDDLYRRRLQSLQAVDDAVANLTDTLRRTGQLRNTYIVFMSDNGYHLGQHRLPAGKQTAYEEDIHVPLIVRGPGVPSGVTRDQIVGNVDLAPTFADLARVRSPKFVDGRSLVPLLRSQPPPHRWRRAYLVEHWREIPRAGHAPARAGLLLEPPDADQADNEMLVPPGPRRRGRRSAAQHDPSPEYHGIRTARYLYVEYATGERELYDLRRDPAEMTNLALRAPADLLRRLHSRVAELETCREERCRTAEQRTL